MSAESYEPTPREHPLTHFPWVPIACIECGREWVFINVELWNQRPEPLDVGTCPSCEDHPRWRV